MPRARAKGDTLSERETECLARIAQGLTDKEIGEQLFLGRESIRTYNRRIYVKLGARNRAHAVAIAFAEGLL